MESGLVAFPELGEAPLIRQDSVCKSESVVWLLYSAEDPTHVSSSERYEEYHTTGVKSECKELSQYSFNDFYLFAFSAVSLR